VILAIDPGPKESAYALLDRDLSIREHGKVDNEEMLLVIEASLFCKAAKYFVIEMVASYGMAVGADVFETVFWTGRFWQAANIEHRYRIYRKDVKLNLCLDSRAKDSNIRQALIDRFGPIGTKKNPGWFYGVSKDVWSAIALGVTFADLYLNKDERRAIK